MQYEIYCFSNGLRVIHLPSSNLVSYCGFAVNAGTREERPTEFGLAHFVEHMLFKGTQKRKAWHILNLMENVGGEINAYTTKEETFVYTVSLADDIERAIELLSDIIWNSRFPEKEIEKEREVVVDEINSYKDNPAELIFDDFENLVFSGHPIGHHILGDKKSLKTFNYSTCFDFYKCFYQPENMIFFSYGKTPLKKLIKLLSKYMPESNITVQAKRYAPESITPKQIESDKKLHQAHVILGAKAYGLHDKKRTGLYLLNNLLGGPGMNSRLNLSLREKHGLVYTVESGLTSYSDTGLMSIYFACDHQSKDKGIELVLKELKRLRDEKLNPTQLAAAKKQLKGQLGISADQNENIALGMGKSFLHLNRYDNLQQVYEKIDELTSSVLLEIANEIMSENNLFQLVFK